LFLGETWSKRLGLGMALSLLGVILVITKGSLAALLSMTFNIGDLFLIGSMISWVFYGLVGKVIMKGVSPLFTTAVTTFVGSVFLGICSAFEGGWQQVPEMSAQVFWEIFYMTVFATVIGFILWNMGVHRVGASKASAFMNLVPINAMWISVLLYGADLLWIQIVGMVMVICGVVLSNRQQRKVVKELVQEKAV
jgi:drug/metabolite transporter (DMT)-like permease